MRIPVLRGLIDRRILVNYRVDPAVLGRLVPPPFRPQLVGGHGVAGICLIRLKQVRPRWLPSWCGVGSENAAHRIAVEWEDDGRTRQGVYIPRRDTSSRLNTLAGGRLFPGVHHHARFRVAESRDRLEVALAADDRRTRLFIAARVTNDWPSGSVFASLDEASAFFQNGALGYSVTRRPGVFDGLELRTLAWRMQPLAVEHVESSFFDSPALFPPGSARFDSALLMRDLEHEWHGRGCLCSPAADAQPARPHEVDALLTEALRVLDRWPGTDLTVERRRLEAARNGQHAADAATVAWLQELVAMLRLARRAGAADRARELTAHLAGALQRQEGNGRKSGQRSLVSTGHAGL